MSARGCAIRERVTTTGLRSRRGFSLVEISVVVAIVGILAAIALPNFLALRLKAKRSEILVDVSGIKDAEVAYDAAFNRYLDLELAPSTPGAGGQSQVEWDGPAVDGDWDSLGWRPDGKVRGLYSVETNFTGCAGWTPSGSLPNFCIVGLSDVDGDGVQAHHYADLEHNAELVDLDAY